MDTITTEIELVRFGPVVQMTASFKACPAEPDVGYMSDYFEFEVESYAHFDEDTGDILPAIDGNDLIITNSIYEQLADAAMQYEPATPERITRACDIKDSLMAPLFESLAQDYNSLTVRK